MAGKAFTPPHMRDDSLIFAFYTVKWPKEKTAGTIGTNVPENATPIESLEHKGNLLIHDL